MKIFLLLFITIITVTGFGQTTPPAKKGNYFETNSKDYFEKVIEPWRYQYTATENLKNPISKIGEITFWRSEALYDSVSKQYWKPNISYDIYPALELKYVDSLADKIKSSSSCDSINKGGDLILLGRFILISSSSCANCASASNIDYCRNIIKRIVTSVPDKNTSKWNKIMNQFVVKKGKFK